MARIEQQLTVTPDDLRGWTVIAPVYMQSGRYADAERAYRRILELAPPTADAETDLAEALMMQNGGVIAGEPLALLESAAARDPKHVRSRFYLAGEATRVGRLRGGEGEVGRADRAWAGRRRAWLETARTGLAAAEAGLAGGAAPAVDEAQIRGMVEGLDARLTSEGGTDRGVDAARALAPGAGRDSERRSRPMMRRLPPIPMRRVRTELDALARRRELKGVAG